MIKMKTKQEQEYNKEVIWWVARFNYVAGCLATTYAILVAVLILRYWRFY